MNGNPTTDTKIFVRRLSSLHFYEEEVKRFNDELQHLEKSISTASASNPWGVSVPYGESEIIDGKKVLIKYRNEFLPVTRNGYHQPNQDILWRMEELETMITQYETEINYIKDILDICSETVSKAVASYYLEDETWQSIADSIPISRATLERRIERELKHALKGAIAP
ncbi:hypothetical protein MGH68_12070 [Erysipelothrix sp. D19-032]